jgi:outer membrane protein OmpA-like peptidoglycan-associated protein
LAEAVSTAWSQDSRFSSATVTFHHLDGIVGGQVPDAAAKADLLSRARAAKPAGRLLDAVTILPPRDQPILLSLSRQGGQPRLSGTVGDASVKDTLAQALGAESVSGLSVSDRVQAPDWAPSAAAPFLVRFLEQVPGGTLDLRGNDLVLRGKIRGEDARDSILAEARSFLPEAGTLHAEIDLLPDRPARLTVRRSGSRWTLEGQLPDAASSAPVLAALGAPESAVTNSLQADPRVVAPAWGTALPPFLNTFFAGGDGTVSLDGSRLTLAGDRPASRGRASWLDALAPLRAAGCEVTDQVRLVPDLDPTLAVTATPQGWVLEGRVPDEATRKGIADTAASLAGSTPLRDGLTANPAVRPAPWLAEAEALLRTLFGAGRPGQLSLGGNAWKLAGDAASAAERDALVARISPWVPSGSALDSAGYRFAAPVPGPRPAEVPWVRLRFAPSERRLEGRLGDDASRTALETAMQSGARPPSVALRNDLQVSPDVTPAPWIPPLSRFLPRFGTAVREGTIEIRDGKLSLTGEAKDAATRDTLLAELSSSLPNGMVKIEDRMTLAKAAAPMPSPGPDKAPTAPAPKPDGSWPTYKVYFNKNSTYIRPDDAATVAEAASGLDGMPAGTTVLVKGFADNRGHPIGNQALSEERATAVKDRLIALGIPEERIELIGVGESESRTGTSDRIWKLDRRVEIIVVRK